MTVFDPRTAFGPKNTARESGSRGTRVLASSLTSSMPTLKRWVSQEVGRCSSRIPEVKRETSSVWW
ncbi:MAG: hypothetical protein F4Z92_14455 [Gemmatimonadetes bacterium]|nr:hypothetical protein [Gemmatimonadota bacterium]